MPDNLRSYRASMCDHMYVQVPSDFWALLEEDGFDEVEIRSRGGDQLVQIVHVAWSGGKDGLDIASGLVGVYLARDQIVSFVRRLAFWADRNPPKRDGDRFVLNLTSGTGRDAVRISVDCRKTAEGKPDVDIEALTRVMNSLLTGTDT